MDRQRILIADDNELILERVTTLLTPSFDVIGVAHDGKQLITEALRLQPDVIIADISMPIFTGIEAARQIRETGSTSRFVFLTIHQEDEFLDACFQEGAHGYVIKSHMKTDLISAVHAAISGLLFISPVVARSR